MGIFTVEKTGTVVLPSGIQAELRGLQGKHQAMITINDEAKRRKGIDTMLKESIVRLGNKTDIVLADVKNLLSADRKALLFELRQISNNHDRNFVFDYEFPTKGGKKLKQRYEVDFINEQFPTKPYFWVAEKMVAAYKAENSIEGALDDVETKEALAAEIPVLFEDYNEILELASRNLKLPECGVTVFWNMLDGEQETRFAKLLGAKEANITSHEQIKMRRPTYIPEEAKGNENAKSAVPLDQLSLIDIEALRRDIMSKEGDVDSFVVVQYKGDSTIQAQVDLLSTPAFFFASLAL